jgi:23S rRNA (guanosine2251-2'-O)-methyltransferase
MFCTVLNRLKSPTNVGMIVRSHVAFGGQQVVFIGDDKPWEFRKGSQSFSPQARSAV